MCCRQVHELMTEMANFILRMINGTRVRTFWPAYIYAVSPRWPHCLLQIITARSDWTHAQIISHSMPHAGIAAWCYVGHCACELDTKWSTKLCSEGYARPECGSTNDAFTQLTWQYMRFTSLVHKYACHGFEVITTCPSSQKKTARLKAIKVQGMQWLFYNTHNSFSLSQML